MKQLLSILLLSICLYAEATFDQVQSMIDKQQYKQAVLALTIISNNHPASSKVQYTLAQAQAGLGNLPAAKDALDRAIALNPKLDFVSASQVNELSSIINAPRVIKPVEPESHWFIWLLSITGVSFVIAYFIRNNKSGKLSTPDVKPSTKYSPSPSKSEESFYEHTSTAKPTPVNPTNGRSYSEPPKEAPSRPVYNRTSSYEPTRTSRPAEVHQHHSASKSDIVTTLATAGLTAAAVSYAMNHDEPEQPTHLYEPESISSSWDDSYSVKQQDSSTWEDESSKSSSWNDDSSSISNSWSDSSSDNSSSSWND